MKAAALLALAFSVTLSACEREERTFRADAGTSETHEQVALVTIAPGPSPPVESKNQKGKQVEKNAYHLAQGKKLYGWFNCNGCHANGGGGSGPALIDDKWIYGSAIENIVATIREGRPNGMPSFRGRIPDDQIWEIAAYVRSMAGQVSSDAAPGRNDDMHPRPAENRLPSTSPKSAEHPD